MSLNFRTEEYYKRFIELQEKLRKSEEERLKLEMKFNEMLQVTREEEQIHFRKLRSQYKRFLEEDRRRQDRNERILRSLERIESRVAVLIAKTERVKLLKQQYHAILDRMYTTNQTARKEATKKTIEPVDDKNDLVQTYIQNLSSNKLREMLQKEEQARARLPSIHITGQDEKFSYSDLYSFSNGETKPNYANTIADDIMSSIYSRTHKFRRDVTPKPDFESDSIPSYKKLPTFENYSNEAKSIVSEIEDTESDAISESAEVLRRDTNFSLQEKIFGSKVDDKHLLETASGNLDFDFSKAKLSKENDLKESNYQEQIDKQFPQNVAKEPSVECVKAQAENVTPRAFGELDTTAKPDVLPIEKKRLDEIPKESSTYAEEVQDRNEVPQKQIVEETSKPEVITNVELHDSSVKDTPLVEEEKESYQTDLQNIAQAEYKQEPVKEFKEPVEYDQQYYENSKQPALQYDEQDGQQYDQQQYDANEQPIGEYQSRQEMQQYDESGQPIGQYQEQYDSQPIQQYDEPIQQYDEPIQQYDEPIQQHDEPIQQFNQSGQPMQQYDQSGQPIQQYDESGQPIQEYDEPIQHYDEPNQQYDQSGQPIQQYDESGQLIQQYDEPIQQYDQSGQPIQQYDESGQPIQQYDEPIQQYDESGQPIQQYDETGQPIQQYSTDPEQYQDQAQYQYDEHGQIIGQYDEHGQLIYDQSAHQYDENGQLIESYNYAEQPQYDENGQLIQQTYDDQQYYNEFAQENNVIPSQDEAQDNKTATQEEVKEPVRAGNVMEMLDTDTESLRQDTRVSHDSDFDFSNA